MDCNLVREPSLRREDRRSFEQHFIAALVARNPIGILRAELRPW